MSASVSMCVRECACHTRCAHLISHSDPCTSCARAHAERQWQVLGAAKHNAGLLKEGFYPRLLRLAQTSLIGTLFRLSSVHQRNFVQGHAVVPLDNVAIELPLKAKVVQPIAREQLRHVHRLLSHGRVSDHHRLARRVDTHVDFASRTVLPLPLKLVRGDHRHGERNCTNQAQDDAMNRCPTQRRGSDGIMVIIVPRVVPFSSGGPSNWSRHHISDMLVDHVLASGRSWMKEGWNWSVDTVACWSLGVSFVTVVVVAVNVAVNVAVAVARALTALFLRKRLKLRRACNFPIHFSSTACFNLANQQFQVSFVFLSWSATQRANQLKHQCRTVPRIERDAHDMRFQHKLAHKLGAC